MRHCGLGRALPPLLYSTRSIVCLDALQSTKSLSKAASELSLNGNGGISHSSSRASLHPSGSTPNLAQPENLRTVTGVLTSRPTSRDIRIDNFSMGVAGTELVTDCSIELTIGRRYGLLGQNGCGKTNFLQCLAEREVCLAYASCVPPDTCCGIVATQQPRSTAFVHECRSRFQSTWTCTICMRKRRPVTGRRWSRWWIPSRPSLPCCRRRLAMPVHATRVSVEAVLCIIALH